MAALFLDLDGTTVDYHTSEWLPCVLERLTALAAAGHQIIFITMRGSQDVATAWSVEQTEHLLDTLPFAYRLLTGVGSPRIFVDDTHGRHIHAATNRPETWLSEVRL